MNKEKQNKLVPKWRFPEFKDDDGWDEKTLGSVCFETYSGGTPSTSERNYYGGKIPFIRSAEIGKEVTELFLSEDGLKNSSAKLVSKGDLLVALYGANSGDVALARVGGAINQAILCLKAGGSNAFIFQFLSFKKDWIVAKFIQGGQGNLSGEIVKSIKLLFPSLAEQQKIADCLSSLDELITAHNAGLEALKAHKKGLLQQLFPAEGEKVPRLRFPEFGDSGEWEEKKLGEITTYFKGFAFQSKDYTSMGRRIIRVSDMGFDHIKDDGNAIYIHQDDADQYDRWKLQKEDLIITTVGSKPPVYDSLVGRTIVVKQKHEGTLLNQNAVALRSKNNILQSFLNVIFKRKEYITFVKSIIRGNANQGSITLEDFFQYKILFPKPEEQQKIASCLLSLDERIDAQTEKIAQLRLHKRGLMQGLFPS